MYIPVIKLFLIAESSEVIAEEMEYMEK